MKKLQPNKDPFANIKRQPKQAGQYLGMFINTLPEDQRKKMLVDRKVKQIHDQFAACVTPFIAEHVNSLYLNTEEIAAGPKKTTTRKQPNEEATKNSPKAEETDAVSRETRTKLTVYVDNSTVAAELNALRELTILKYRELFALQIDELIIKISRAEYRNNYPLRKNEEEDLVFSRALSAEEEAKIESNTASIQDPEIRASFQRTLKAIKEHTPKD